MAAALPLRRAGPVSAWFAASLVFPNDEKLEERDLPRVYLAPRPARADWRVVRASLQAAGLRPPRWVASTRTHVDEETMREAFLSGDAVLLPLQPPRRGPDRLARLLHWARAAGREVDLVPIETLWGPEGGRASLWNLLIGNPYDPKPWRRWLRVPGSENARVIVGRPGTVSQLAGEAPDPDDALALAAFVRGQAIKALSQTERQVLGEQYKVPRLLVEQILDEPDFRDRAAAAGATAGLTRAESLEQAERGLRDLYTTHDFLYMEVFRRFCRWLYRKVYDDEIVVDPGEIERLREMSKSSALIFIPSHKSNFDHLIMYYLLFSEGFPPPHTAAGANMSFFPMSRILPRTGAYFIRRSFQNDPVYKEALAGFMNYLVQRRFHQEFFIEGGRTRSGKLLPPRYGMLRYIVEGSARSGVTDVRFVPTALSYDQLLEVDEYARQLGGEDKRPESFSFLVRMILSLRGRSFGRVYMRFAEPIELGEHLERTRDQRLLVEKLAFQISNQINASTTLTAVSLLSSALCSSGRRALTLPELEQEVQRMLDYAGETGIHIGRELEQGAKAAVEAGIEALSASSVISVYDGGLEAVYSISEKRHLVASFYRNTVIHFFVVGAIAALAREAADQRDDVDGWSLRLRDLLKFEFFFAERDPFREQIAGELQRLARDEERGVGLLGAAAPGILLDYLESYWVVTEALRTLPPGDTALDEGELLTRCHAIGQQKLLQNDVHAPQLLSNLNFRNGLELAANLGAARTDQRGYLRGDADVLDALTRDLSLLARLARRSHRDA